MKSPHYYRLAIFYEDTDAGQVVYHANYLKFMERARTIFLQEKGLKLSSLIENFGIQFLVRAATLRFEQPARLEQKLVVATKIAKYGRASLTFSQDILFDLKDCQTMICSGEIVIVCLNLQFRPCGIPKEVLRELQSEN